MELNLRLTLQNLDNRLRSFTSREWRIAVYAVDRAGLKAGEPVLRRVEAIGHTLDEVIDLVASAASVTRTTIVGDVAKIAESLRDPAELEKYRSFGVHHIGAGVAIGNARGSVIAAPCFDPFQTITSERVPGRVVGAIAAAGDAPAQDVVANDNLRYLIEQYAKTVASFLETRPTETDFSWQEWTLPDIEIMPAHASASQKAGDVVEQARPAKAPTYSQLVVFPNEAVRITGYSKDFEPYTTRGEKWLQFGPGLALSKNGLESFVRGWTQRKADSNYIQQLDTSDVTKHW